MMKQTIRLKANKKLSFGHNRSKALNITPRVWKQNIQKHQIRDPKTQTVYTLFLTAKELKTIRRRHNGQKKQ